MHIHSNWIVSPLHVTYNVSVQVCAPPSPAYSPAYSAAPDCSSAVRRVCYKQPALVPVVKKVRHTWQ